MNLKQQTVPRDIALRPICAQISVISELLMHPVLWFSYSPPSLTVRSPFLNKQLVSGYMVQETLTLQADRALGIHIPFL